MTFTNYSQLKGQTVDLIAVVGVIVLMHFAAQKSSDIGKRGICAKREVIFGNNRSLKHPLTIRGIRGCVGEVSENFWEWKQVWLIVCQGKLVSYNTGLHKLCQPGSLAVRKWRGNEKMKRKWRENEEIEREWGNGERFTLYSPVQSRPTLCPGWTVALHFWWARPPWIGRLK